VQPHTAPDGKGRKSQSPSVVQDLLSLLIHFAVAAVLVG
jgi:hypothetical protein